LLIGELLKLEAIVNIDIELYSFLISGLVMNDNWSEDFAEFTGLSFNGSGEVGYEAFFIGDY
jgi:hypothetical protein